MTQLLIQIAPLLMAFELCQLLLAERYIGVKQASARRHPLSSGSAVLPFWATALWLLGMAGSLIYMVLLLGDSRTAFQGLLMLGITAVGFSIRRSVGLKWGLVVLTVERAAVIGLMVSVMLYGFNVVENSGFYGWAARHWMF